MQECCRSRAASFEPMAYCWNLFSVSLFYSYYLGRCSSEQAQFFPLSSSQGRSTHYSDRLHDFSVVFPRYFKDVLLLLKYSHKTKKICSSSGLSKNYISKDQKSQFTWFSGTIYFRCHQCPMEFIGSLQRVIKLFQIKVVKSPPPSHLGKSLILPY